jgi:hypothetical protein
MNARQGLADALAKKLGRKYKVIPKPREMDALEAGRPVVMVIRTDVQPAANAQGSYLNEIAVWVIDPSIEDEDALDDALDATILAIDDYPFVIWTKAERSTYGELYPAYRIATTALSQKE